MATIKPLVIDAVDIKGLVIERAVPLKGKMSNPNDFEVSLRGTTITVNVTVDKDHRGCDVANFAVVAPSTKSKLIKAKESVKLDEGSITLLNTELDQAACMGATLTLDYLLK